MDFKGHAKSAPTATYVAVQRPEHHGKAAARMHPRPVVQLAR